MKAAGCWRTRFGVESGSDQVLDFISKGITKEDPNAITWADEVGLRPKAFFMVGHMPDTRETIRRPSSSPSPSRSMTSRYRSTPSSRRHRRRRSGSARERSGVAS